MTDFQIGQLDLRHFDEGAHLAGAWGVLRVDEQVGRDRETVTRTLATTIGGNKRERMVESIQTKDRSRGQDGGK